MNYGYPASRLMTNPLPAPQLAALKRASAKRVFKDEEMAVKHAGKAITNEASSEFGAAAAMLGGDSPQELPKNGGGASMASTS
jgi:hypothetical protein